MKKYNKKQIILVVLSIFAVALCIILPCVFGIIIPRNIQNEVKNVIEQTKSYIEEKELDNSTFTNIFQSFLKKSLIYNTQNNEYLVLYKDKKYTYKDNKLSVSNQDIVIYDNLEEALNSGNSLNSVIFTKGLYFPFDNGNSCYVVDEYVGNKDEIYFSNELKTFSLKFVTFDSIINIYQMGYRADENIDTYVNKFTSDLKYNSIFLTQGTYKITNNFDINVSNKNYFAKDVKLFADDTYAPTGWNNGCLFNVYNNISNIKINGISLDVITNKKLGDPILGLLSARDVDGLIMNNCSFYLSKEAHIYSSSGIIDLFTGWKNVVVKNCKLENHSSTVAGGGIGVRDIYQKRCYNALFENNYLYSNCRDEVIAIFSGSDTSLGYSDDGSGYIENVVFKNNTIIGGEQNLENTKTPRVVGITVGYQKSPVKDISFIDNEIQMYSANYFLLYGKADTVKFQNNNIKIDASYTNRLYKIICHNSNADEGYNILFNANNVEMINSSVLNTIAETGDELEFSNNVLKGEKVYRLFDSLALFNANTIQFNSISECVYRCLKQSINNIITTNSINVVYEFYNLNISNNIEILGDQIETEEISRNFMMFNGTNIYFNNHTLTFKNFIFNTKRVLEEKYYYLAYGTDAIQDSGIINFVNSNISVYENIGHNTIEKNNNKVIVNFINN